MNESLASALLVFLYIGLFSWQRQHIVFDFLDGVKMHKNISCKYKTALLVHVLLTSWQCLFAYSVVNAFQIETMQFFKDISLKFRGTEITSADTNLTLFTFLEVKNELLRSCQHLSTESKIVHVLNHNEGK